MPGTPVPFPTTALPSRRHHSPQNAGQGDLVNAMAVQRGNETHWIRTPGLERFTPAVAGRAPRGILPVDNYLIALSGDILEAIHETGTVTRMGATVVAGTGPVTMARNLRSPADIAIVSTQGVYLARTAGMTLATYPLYQPPTPSGGVAPPPENNVAGVNSVEYFSGYFIFTKADGTIIASNLQTTDVNALSYDKAQASADPLWRAINNGDTCLMCGPGTIEVWQDVGKSPFPLQRGAVIPVGILGPWAIAGGPAHWERGVLFAATDGTVRHLQGYDPVIVSNAAVEHDLADWRDDRDNIIAGAYITEGQGIFVLRHPMWTWELNLNTGSWHRRDSVATPGTWRGLFTRNFNGRWYAQDIAKGGLVEVTPKAFTEDADWLKWTVESADLRDMPLSIRVPAVDFDFVVGIGRPELPAPYGTEPGVMISWSHDAGATWSSPLGRGLGQQGKYGQKVTVRNLGRSTHHGMRLKVESNDPVELTFRGAVVPSIQPSRARQVR